MLRPQGQGRGQPERWQGRARRDREGEVREPQEVRRRRVSVHGKMLRADILIYILVFLRQHSTLQKCKYQRYERYSLRELSFEISLNL